jgi:hypothetical protein
MNNKSNDSNKPNDSKPTISLENLNLGQSDPTVTRKLIAMLLLIALALSGPGSATVPGPDLCL